MDPANKDCPNPGRTGTHRAQPGQRCFTEEHFGDAPKAIHLPDGGRVNGTAGMGGGPIGAGIPPAGADLSSLRPPLACDAYNFSYGELERAPQGPFGVITSEYLPAYNPCMHVSVESQSNHMPAALLHTRLQP